MAPVGYALNGLHWILLFLAWVGTCVSFGGVLHESKPSNGGGYTSSYYYNYYSGGGISYTYADAYDKFCQNGAEGCDGLDKCKTGGRGFVAMQVFSFLALLFVLVIVTLRILGRQSIIPALGTPQKAIRTELLLVSVALFFYFLAVCIWGGTCFQKTKDSANTNATATGFAFVVVDFFFLILDIVLLCIIMKNTLYQLGGGEMEQKHQQQTDQPQINAHPGDQMPHHGSTGGDPNLVELTCPSCAAKVTCPRGGQTNCAVCDAEITA